MFTSEEINLLRDFYIRKIRAKELRLKYKTDPWAVVSRYRNLPREKHEAIRELVYKQETV